MKRRRLLYPGICLLSVILLVAGCSAPLVPPAPMSSLPTPAPDVVAAVVALSQPQIHAVYPSPDHKWQAEVVIHACVQTGDGEVNAYEQLRLVRTSDGAETVVAGQLRNCGGLGTYGLEGLHWSADSRYFYYTDAREGVPDGSESGWERPVYRLEIDRNLHG